MGPPLYLVSFAASLRAAPAVQSKHCWLRILPCASHLDSVVMQNTVGDNEVMPWDEEEQAEDAVKDEREEMSGVSQTCGLCGKSAEACVQSLALCQFSYLSAFPALLNIVFVWETLAKRGSQSALLLAMTVNAKELDY